MAEATSGIGLMIGPVLGGFIFEACGYFWTFTIFGIILGLSALITLLITPNSLNISLA